MPYIQVKGRIIRFEEKGQKKSKRLIAYFQDESGLIELIWFKGIRWIKQGIRLNTDYLIFGKPSIFKDTIKSDEIKLVESVYNKDAIENYLINECCMSPKRVHNSLKKIIQCSNNK